MGGVRALIATAGRGSVPRRVLRLLVGAGLLAVAIGWGSAAPVLAADPDFGKPTIDGAFGEGIELTQPVTLDTTPSRVEILIATGDAQGPLVVEAPPPTATGAVTLRYRLDVGTDGHILPNTPVRGRWRLTYDEGGGTTRSVTGPEVATVYDDDRFDWKTVRGDIVRVHWYEGGQAFGERALRIGEAAVKETGALLGVTEEDPIDFFIYADNAAFYDALGPGTRENVGGQANAEIRTLFALIAPGSIDDPWVGTVVPHELVHLVFDTAVENPYHFPPRWLNEGLAVYLSQGYDSQDRRMVESAASQGNLVPLDGLSGQFPTTADRFFLAYAESVSAVDYLIRTYGQETLVGLIGSYADGLTDDEAFQAALGTDVAGFSTAWLVDLDAVVPVRHGPQDAPAGPEPPDWASGPAAPSANGSAGAPAAPAGTLEPEGSPPPATGGGAESGVSGTSLMAGMAIVTAALLVALVVVRRRRGSVDP